MTVQASSSPTTSVDTSGQSLGAGHADADARPRASGLSRAGARMDGAEMAPAAPPPPPGALARGGTRRNGAERPPAALAAPAVDSASGSMTFVAGPRPSTMPENVQVPV